MKLNLINSKFSSLLCFGSFIVFVIISFMFVYILIIKPHLDTSPHQVENLTVVVVDVNSIRIEWTPGFDGGFPQKILVW